MIVVDTSVWVAARRKPNGALATALDSLLDKDEVALALPVRIELVSGVARRERAGFKRALTALPVAVPTEETWPLIARWIETAADAGHRFGLADLLISALAHELGALVWTLDADFERMAALGFVNLYALESPSR